TRTGSIERRDDAPGFPSVGVGGIFTIPKLNSDYHYIYFMFLRIETHQEVHLAGFHCMMSLLRNQTSKLWQQLMPLRQELSGKPSPKLYSLEIYPSHYFTAFDPDTCFLKWACVPIQPGKNLDDEIKEMILQEGLYAVFLHQGPASAGEKTYRYIHETWLPESAYTLDERPHMSIMDERYKGEDENSEEEIWIPIKHK
ncbi:MAG: GyrI-like domain-containing protein, partial [Bacteroidota bacterium]|nr:GyrI-like domain-containing protein [Bacteroidota bacterium]MDX5429811.1 GyrI-like domain-containing protein [Bacteroidota bacterium]MDX5468590.1 GyrI-like domain-containing protein [Bacteroidota bacterium]